MIIKNKIDGFNYTKLSYSDFANTLTTIDGATRHDLGMSTSGDKIYALSRGDLQTKPVIFIVGSLHGEHEWRGAYIVREFFKLLNNPTPQILNFDVSELLSKYAFYGIVCANPYGYKNNVRGNGNGVDLNRNFDVYWNEFDGPIGTPYFKGDSPFSEPETQIIRNKILEIKPFAFVDLHIYGNSTNFVCTTDIPMFKEIEGAIERITQVPRLKQYGTDNFPMSHLWVKTLNGARNQKCIAWLFEPGALETDFTKSVIGINGLFIYLHHLNKWYKKQVSRLY